MTADISQYLTLIPRENRSKPKFVATVSATVQPLADIAAVAAGLTAAFDLDNAVGAQLDAVGEWVGRSRAIETPLEGVYFSLDIAGLGLDEGWLQGQFDPDTGLVSLGDEQYRTLIRAKIAANHWDGSIPDAYRLLSLVFPDHVPVISDYGDMSMFIGLIGSPLGVVETALFSGGYLSIKPAGVQIVAHGLSPSYPFFGLDADNNSVGGLDNGYLWGNDDFSAYRIGAAIIGLTTLVF